MSHGEPCVPIRQDWATLIKLKPEGEVNDWTLDTKFLCYVCSKECNGFYESVLHIGNVHPHLLNGKNAHCIVCPKSFTRRDHLKNHLWRHINSLRQTPKCVVKGSRNSFDWREMREWVCQKCNLTCRGLTEFANHQRSFHDSVMDCPFCKRIFPSKKKFSVHLNCHSEQRDAYQIHKPKIASVPELPPSKRCFPDKPFETFGGQPAVDATIFQESAATTDHIQQTACHYYVDVSKLSNGEFHCGSVQKIDFGPKITYEKMKSQSCDLDQPEVKIDVIFDPFESSSGNHQVVLPQNQSEFESVPHRVEYLQNWSKYHVFKCYFCASNLQGLEFAKNHFISHNLYKVSPLQCFLCLKTCSNTIQLENHLLLHIWIDLESRNQNCLSQISLFDLQDAPETAFEFGDLTSFSQSALNFVLHRVSQNSHILENANNRDEDDHSWCEIIDLKCFVCGMQITGIENSSKHMLLLHKELVPFGLSCILCSATCYDISLLTVHIWRHFHPDACETGFKLEAFEMSDEASLIEKSLPVKENHEFPILKTLPFTDHESSNIFCAVIESNQNASVGSQVGQQLSAFDEFFGFPLVTPIEAPPQKVAKFGPVRLAVSHQGTSIPTRISSEIQKANRRHVEEQLLLQQLHQKHRLSGKFLTANPT